MTRCIRYNGFQHEEPVEEEEKMDTEEDEEKKKKEVMSLKGHLLVEQLKGFSEYALSYKQ